MPSCLYLKFSRIPLSRSIHLPRRTYLPQSIYLSLLQLFLKLPPTLIPLVTISITPPFTSIPPSLETSMTPTEATTLTPSQPTLNSLYFHFLKLLYQSIHHSNSTPSTSNLSIPLPTITLDKATLNLSPNCYSDCPSFLLDYVFRTSFTT